MTRVTPQIFGVHLKLTVRMVGQHEVEFTNLLLLWE